MSGRKPHECNDAAPHRCAQGGCGEPAYIGFGVPCKCVGLNSGGHGMPCVFFDRKLYNEWVMLLPDDGIPLDPTEPDFFDDEDTNPGVPTLGFLKTFASISYKPQPTQVTPSNFHSTQLDDWGAVLGQPRNAGESDDDYRDRLLQILGRRP